MAKKIITKKAVDNEQVYKDAVKTLESLPPKVLAKNIELNIEILKKKGFNIADFDNKDKYVKQVRFIGNNCYFLCGKDEEAAEEEKERYDMQRETINFLNSRIQVLMKENERLRKQTK